MKNRSKMHDLEKYKTIKRPIPEGIGLIIR